MKNNNYSQLKTLLGTAVTTACIVSAAALPASAGALTGGTTLSLFLECLNDGISLGVGRNPTDEAGWQYAIDSYTDGVAGNNVGGNAYEIYSMGVKETSDNIFITINSNTPYDGNRHNNAQNGTIALGDLFINLDALELNFQQASDAGSLYAIRFVANNDSGVAELGVYSNVTAKSVTEVNAGFKSIKKYNQHVTNKGKTPSFGDLPANTDYFDRNQSLNVIASGNFLTGLTLLSQADLTAAGFDWEQTPGKHTLGFKFDKSVLPGGTPEPESVPEPGAMVGLVILGTTFVVRRRDRKVSDG